MLVVAGLWVPKLQQAAYANLSPKALLTSQAPDSFSIIASRAAIFSGSCRNTSLEF